MSDFATLLESPVMKQALAVLLEEEVSSTTPIDARVDTLQLTALCGANREGYFRYYKAFKSLANKPMPKSSEPRQFQHLAKKESNP